METLLLSWIGADACCSRSENGLRSLSNIAPLPRLQTLSCVSNRIGELAETDVRTATPYTFTAND